jgi:hypothetical protein
MSYQVNRNKVIKKILYHGIVSGIHQERKRRYKKTLSGTKRCKAWSSELVNFLLIRTVLSKMKANKRHNRRKEGRR